MIKDKKTDLEIQYFLKIMYSEYIISFLQNKTKN